MNKKIAIDFDGVIIDSIKYFYDNFASSKYAVESNVPDGGYVKLLLETVVPVTANAPLKDGVVETLKMLRNDGYKLFLVTGRGTLGKNFSQEMIDAEINTAKKRLEKTGLVFDGEFWATSDKAQVCKDNGFTIMIEDEERSAQKLQDAGIFTLYFRRDTAPEIKGENIVEVGSWQKIYEIILKNRN